MSFPDFASYFQGLKSNGFTIQHAVYWDSFGSWSIEFSSDQHRPHRLIWDGKDRWLILQCERPKSERTHFMPPEKLRMMSYIDGVQAQTWSEEDAWKDKWIGREQSDQTLEHALKELSSYRKR
jgi:hypothetical protein